MIEREYYSLAQAAETLNCQKKDIIYLGANEKLPVYMLTDKYIISGYHVGYDGTSTLYNYHGRLIQIKPSCLRESESGNNQIAVLLVSQADNKGAYHPKVRNKGYSPGKDTLVKSWKNGTDPHLNDDPVMLKDCELVILHDDLKHFQEPEQQVKNVTTDVKEKIYVNEKRNEVAAKWMSDKKPDLDPMTCPEIVAALEAFSRTLKAEDGSQAYKPGLFSKGNVGLDWLNRDHSVILRRRAGCKSGK